MCGVWLLLPLAAAALPDTAEEDSTDFGVDEAAAAAAAAAATLPAVLDGAVDAVDDVGNVAVVNTANARTKCST